MHYIFNLLVRNDTFIDDCTRRPDEKENKKKISAFFFLKRRKTSLTTNSAGRLQNLTHGEA